MVDILLMQVYSQLVVMISFFAQCACFADDRVKELREEVNITRFD